MLLYYFVPFIVSNRYLLFRDSNGHNSVTVQNRTHIYMNFFDHKDLGPTFGRVFLRSNYNDITQNTYIQSSMVTEILAQNFETLTAITHLLITKYILKLAGICGFCNVNICT